MEAQLKRGGLPLPAAGPVIRLGAVSYLNTKPLVYGLEQGMMRNELEVQYDYPGRVAAALLKGEIDAGLVPVAILPQLPGYRIISDYGIAADGAVASVALFSEVPLHELKTVLLDYQSRTSVMLARYLLQHHWKHTPVFEAAGPDFIQQIGGSTGAVIIGDRALSQAHHSAYMYDLAEAWKAHTGLPFVFAAWVSRVEVPDDFIARFNAANALGFEQLDEVIRQNPFPDFDLGEYYTQYIQYRLDETKLIGLRHFLQEAVMPHLIAPTGVPS